MALSKCSAKSDWTQINSLNFKNVSKFFDSLNLCNNLKAQVEK